MTGRLRIWRRIRILPGVTMNVGKTGATSFSFGRSGMRYTIGRKNSRATIGVPGTGAFVTAVEPRKRRDPNGVSGQDAPEEPRTVGSTGPNLGVSTPAARPMGSTRWLWGILAIICLVTIFAALSRG
jgi:hypothetical protein